VTDGQQSMETIEIITSNSDPLARWAPVVGAETLGLLEHLALPRESTERLQREAVTVLGRCAPPDCSDGQETGLVLGYVQSGKTMSFTTVTALARDNGYRLIIVSTGLTRNLFNQSRERLERDLRLTERRDRQWFFFHNPRSRPDVLQSIQMALEDDDDDLPGARRPTVLIAVMKNGTWLDHLRRLLSQLNLTSIPALIIDDEADQASLNNNVRDGTESATYRRILAIRRLLTHHTFLQYTATPQALLLINIIDVLSPNFAEVLTPGPTYTGGRAFFEGDLALARRIPDAEIPVANRPLHEPPESLLEAMRVFFLGVAVGIRGGEQGNRSMMVHPSKRTMPHGDYFQWVRGTQKVWDGILAAWEGEADHRDLIEDFRRAYTDLRGTVPDIPDFEELAPYLRRAIRRTVVTEVNAARGQTPQPDWRQIYSHIVVGGEVLNRGYTLEGLTVTYMQRGPGMNQADTIQQRARWFGYKADYLGYCRVYLSEEMLQAYRGYVDHESRLRDQLREHRATGNSLRDWRRAFFLDPKLRPTRDMVLDLEAVRGCYADSWFEPKAPHDSPEAIQANRELVRRLEARLGNRFHHDDGDARRTETQIHSVAFGIPLRLVYEELLTRLRVTRLVDSVQFTGLLLQVGRYLEGHPDATCNMYRMSGGLTRERGLDGDDQIPTLFQGANYDRSTSPPETIYPGDREIHAPDTLTVQVHTLEVKRGSTTQADNVPAIAVWVPRAMEAGWVSQPQPS
jgi:hypothetical protein